MRTIILPAAPVAFALACIMTGCAEPRPRVAASSLDPKAITAPAASGTPLRLPVALPPGILPRPDPASIGQIDLQLAAALRYPAAAKAAGEQGQPMVSFDIDRDGRILDAHLAQDSGSDPLDAEAVDVFKRIGAFHIKVPTSHAPGHERFTLGFGIGFYLFHDSQRDPARAEDAPEGEAREIVTSIPDGWRAGLVAAIGNAVQKPADLPEHYKLVLHLLLDKDGQP